MPKVKKTKRSKRNKWTFTSNKKLKLNRAKRINKNQIRRMIQSLAKRRKSKLRLVNRKKKEEEIGRKIKRKAMTTKKKALMQMNRWVLSPLQTTKRPSRQRWNQSLYKLNIPLRWYTVSVDSLQNTVNSVTKLVSLMNAKNGSKRTIPCFSDKSIRPLKNHQLKVKSLKTNQRRK